MDNVLLYNTPDMNGSTIHFMYSNGMGDNGDEQKWSKDNHYYGVGYEYAKGPALFSAMWEMYDHKEQNLKSSQVLHSVDLMTSVPSAFTAPISLLIAPAACRLTHLPTS